MVNKKTSEVATSTTLGDIAAELARARSKAGLSHSDLHRLTGISRSVLFGYENGRTKPGAREIRLLCDALKVSPTRLIYGSDDAPFEVGSSPFPDWLEFDSNDIGTVNTTILMKMLSKEDRLALLTLAHSILEARHGRQELEKAFLAVKMIGQVIKETDRDALDEIGRRVEQEIPPDQLRPRPKKQRK